MPEDIQQLPNTEYFPEKPSLALRYEPQKISLDIQDSIRLKAREIKQRTGEHADFLSIFSELHGDAINNKPMVAESVKHFVGAYDAILSDLVDRLSYGEENLDEDEKVYKSIFNQRIAQGIYVVSRKPESIGYQRAELYFRVIQSLKGNNSQLGIDAMKAMSNAKGQAAAMNIFKDSGWQVYVPDPDDEEDIRTMDVQAVSDFIAVKKGNAVLVDAKGRAELQDIECKKFRLGTEEEYRTASVQKTIDSIRAQGTQIDKYSHLLVKIPTSYKYMHTLGRVDDPNGRSKVLSVASNI